MNKVGLVLEGGGMRGLYTAGVLDYFLDEGIEFHNLIGVSAGACNAASYISRQRGRNLRINTEYVTDKRYISLLGLFRRGSIFGMDFLFDEVPNKLDSFDYDTYANAKGHLTIVSTNCESGKPEYHDGKDMERVNRYLRASSSIPMVAQIVEVDGMKLLDGGTADSIPVQRSIDEGYNKHIIVLTRNEGYVKSKESFAPAYKIKYKRYPELIGTIANRHNCYNESIALAERLEAKGEAVIIRPSKPITIGRFETDKEKLRDLYKVGYEDAKALYPKILRLCTESDNVKFLKA